MLHRLTLSLFLLTGCFRNHGAGDDPTDGGGLDGGAGPWRTCYEADVFGRDGDACAFEDACFGSGACLGVTTRCVDGRVNVERMVDESCPTSCADLEGMTDPALQPCEADFGVCTIPLGECCIASFQCEAGFVRQVGATACDSDCGETGEVCASWSPPPPEGVPCTSDDDCDRDGGAFCLPPGEHPGCGVCSTDVRTCESDPDCPAGAHCAEYEPPCPTCDGTIPTACFENCTPGSCPSDETCEAGACRPLRCEDGGTECPENFRCTGGDGDGCARLACAGDLDCDCGSCIGGRCYEGPGTCQLPRP